MSRKNETHNDCHHDDDHHEGSYMVARNLHSIKDAVEQLIAMIDESDEIESWMEHKISVAKAAVSDVRDALTYEHEIQGGCDVCGSHDHDHDHHEDDVEIEVLSPHHAADDAFGLNKLMGGCSGANENKRFLGSGAINENRQLLTNNSSKKIIVEAVQRVGDIIKVKAKSGKVYEFLPTFGADLEILRCEGYGIRIKK